VQDVTPQLMKSIRLPVGIGLSIGCVTGMRVGRCDHFAAILSATVVALLDAVADPPLEDVSLLPPQAAIATAAIASSAAMSAARAGRDGRPVRDVMGVSPPM
jgi:hypothetical protein